MRILKILNKKNLVGADVVELAPMLDSTGNSACFAAKVVREVILAMN
jgi:agmatinase